MVIKIVRVKTTILSSSLTIKKEKKQEWSSYKERKGNALAPRAEEGRSNLRKAAGSRKQTPIRRYPNVETRQSNTLTSLNEHIV